MVKASKRAFALPVSWGTSVVRIGTRTLSQVRYCCEPAQLTDYASDRG